MSTTNRAFIKAYRHDAAQPKAAAAPAISSAIAPAVRAAAAVTVGGSGPVDLRDQASGALQPKGERRPLSAYISQPQAAPRKTFDPQSDVFRPGTTVASFQWPAVCRTLLQKGGSQLDHVVRILLSRADAGKSLIGVLGLFPKVGATTTALCLASRTAGRGRSVLVADGNFRSPRIASMLDAVPTAGWEEALKHRAPLADAVIHSTGDNLNVLALGPRPVKDSQPLAGGLQAAVTAGVMRHSFDLSIVDLGTFFDPASQPTVLELISNMGVDATVAVVGPDPADPRDVATIVEHLNRSGCELLGVIENRVIQPKAAQ